LIILEPTKRKNIDTPIRDFEWREQALVNIWRASKIIPNPAIFIQFAFLIAQYPVNTKLLVVSIRSLRDRK